MTSKTVYRAISYPTLTGKEPRYVRRSAGEIGYEWCITDPKTRFDVRQGTCEASDIPTDVRDKADALGGRAFSYVEWPQ